MLENLINREKLIKEELKIETIINLEELKIITQEDDKNEKKEK